MVALLPHREGDDSNVILRKKKKRSVLYGRSTSSDDATNTGYHSLTYLDEHQVPSLLLPGDWVGIMDGEGVTLVW